MHILEKTDNFGGNNWEIQEKKSAARTLLRAVFLYRLHKKENGKAPNSVKTQLPQILILFLYKTLTVYSKGVRIYDTGESIS